TSACRNSGEPKRSSSRIHPSDARPFTESRALLVQEADVADLRMARRRATQRYLSATWRSGRTPQPGRAIRLGQSHPSTGSGYRRRGSLAIRPGELLLIELGGDAVLLRVAAARMAARRIGLRLVAGRVTRAARLAVAIRLGRIGARLIIGRIRGRVAHCGHQ